MSPMPKFKVGDVIASAVNFYKYKIVDIVQYKKSPVLWYKIEGYPEGYPVHNNKVETIESIFSLDITYEFNKDLKELLK